MRAVKKIVVFFFDVAVSQWLLVAFWHFFRTLLKIVWSLAGLPWNVQPRDSSESEKRAKNGFVFVHD